MSDGPLQNGHALDISLIYINLVQFEGNTRRQHKSLAERIRANPSAYRSSSSQASELTLPETMYLAQTIEMWAHMSRETRNQFVEIVVVESSIARINKLRACDVKDARALLRQDAEFYEACDRELDEKISFIRDQPEDNIRSLLTTSVKYQAYYLHFKPYFLAVDKITCGYAFVTFGAVVLCAVGWLSWMCFYSLWYLLRLHFKTH